MTLRPETRAWLTLLALSASTAALAVAQPRLAAWAVPAASAALLLLAWVKARVILKHYLGLSAAPAWLRGFTVVLAIYCAVLLGLALTG